MSDPLFDKLLAEITSLQADKNYPEVETRLETALLIAPSEFFDSLVDALISTYVSNSKYYKIISFLESFSLLPLYHIGVIKAMLKVYKDFFLGITDFLPKNINRDVVVQHVDGVLKNELLSMPSSEIKLILTLLYDIKEFDLVMKYVKQLFISSGISDWSFRLALAIEKYNARYGYLESALKSYQLKAEKSSLPKEVIDRYLLVIDLAKGNKKLSVTSDSGSDKLINFMVELP